MPCLAVQKTSGKACTYPVLAGRPYCYHHDPEKAAERRSAARRRRETIIAPPVDLLSLDGQQHHLAAIIRDLERDPQMSPQRATAIIRGLETLMRMTLLIEERERVARGGAGAASAQSPTHAATLAEILGRATN